MIGLLLAAGVALSCDALPGFAQQGPARFYEGENLFEYMDGNSEAYLAYGFLKMNGLTCAKGSQKVLVDVSEMPDAESAYGLFASNQDNAKPVESIGAAGQVVPRKVFFVKGKYFVELAAEEQGDHSELLRSAAKALAGTLEGSTSKPEPLGWFPGEGLTAGPPRLVPESVLGIRALKRGYLATYGKRKLFVVTETSADAAKAAMAKLRTRFPAAEAAQGGEEALQVSDAYLGKMCVIRRGATLVGAAGVEGDGDAVALAVAQLARVPQ